MSELRTGRRLALDWGEARIGVASCDPAGTLAFPVETVAAGPKALDRLIALAREYEPIEIVLGLPRSLSGNEGPSAARIRTAGAELVAALQGAGLTTPVRLVDERLSTVSAARQLHASGRRAKQQRAVIDAAAAVVVLEHALELERAGQAQFGELVSAPGAGT